MMDALRSAMVLLGRDQQAAAYIAAYAGTQELPTAPAASVAPAGIRERLSQAVISGDREGVVPLVEAALSEGLSPLTISNEGLLPGLEEVGRRFESQRYFLPQVIQSADTMQAAFARLKQEMQGEGMATLGRILMATVEGDIHDIGKNIVSVVLQCNNFEVVNMGVMVPWQDILAKAKEVGADIVGLSGLITPSLEEMQVVAAEMQKDEHFRSRQTPLLQAQGVRVTFSQPAGWWRRKDFVAVREASLAVPRGQTLGIVGESGSGKTTLGMALLALGLMAVCLRRQAGGSGQHGRQRAAWRGRPGRWV